MKPVSHIDYLLVYPDLRKNETKPSGGYVEIHITHASQEVVKNIETATLLAKQGFKVRLLPIITAAPNVKNPDAYLIEEDIIIEFNPTASAIERKVRNAKKQANYVLIHVMSGITKGELIRGLRLHIHRAENVIEVWLLLNEELYRLTSTEIRDQTIEDKIQ